MKTAPFWGILFLLAGWGESSAFADAVFPQEAPVRERILGLDDQSSWTLRRGDEAVPLAVAGTADRTAIALAGGWIILGSELDFEPFSLGFISRDETPRTAPSLARGTPWVQAWDQVFLFVTASPGKLAVLYPQTGVCADQDLPLSDLSLFAVSSHGFLYTQGRRTSGQAHWNKPPREEQPLLFFPSDLTAAADGTLWACDSLQARPWKQEEGFWRPQEIPQGAGRITALAPFPDSQGYFAAGEGWVGAFSSDGTKLWIRDQDLSGHPLPRDLRLRAADRRLYLWSSSSRRVWVWLWSSEGLKGPVPAPSGDILADYVRQEISRLKACGSLPQALNVAAGGAELAQKWLIAQPFSVSWKQALEEFNREKAQLRSRITGNGQLTVTWSAPYGRPLADWQWEPDATLPTNVNWTVNSTPFWEGRPGLGKTFQIGLTASKAVWPGIGGFGYGPLQLPSYLSVEITPTEKKLPPNAKKKTGPSPAPPTAPVDLTALTTWVRVPLPVPPQPYDLPVE